MRLEKERLQLEQKKASSEKAKLPLVILGQFGCGMGKSAILAVYAKYLASLNSKSKVLVCTPSTWVTHQMSAHFQVTKLIEELSACSGIFLFEHKRLAEVDEQQLKGTMLLVDEVDILLANNELKARALRARTIIGLSATLGGTVGLQRYSDHFS